MFAGGCNNAPIGRVLNGREPPSPRWYLVNCLSLSRIPLAVLFLFLCADPSVSLQKVSLPLLIVIIVSDVLDGILARRWHVATDVGHALDGFADRAFYFSFAFVACIRCDVPWMWCYLLVLREAILLAARTIFSNWKTTIIQNRIPAKTTGFLVRLVLCLFLVHYYLDLFNLRPLSDYFLHLSETGLRIAAFLLVPFSYFTLYLIVKSYVLSAKGTL